MSHHHEDQDLSRIKTPLWKWLVFLLIVLAMPMLFLTYQSQQTEQAVQVSEE
jgi:hypothetical protein